MMRRATGIPTGGLTKRRAIDLCRVTAMRCRRHGGG
ncbi:putative leader peptide [Streptomyces sp. B6B3]